MAHRETITSFSGKHTFLSNFSPARVTLAGLEFPTVEHGFQAAKVGGPWTRALLVVRTIQEAKTPGQAKRLGRAAELRPDWEAVRVKVMQHLLWQKFRAGTPNAQLLLDTHSAKLIEGNTWGDTTWGCVLHEGTWHGLNMLGGLLMEIRSELARTEVSRPSGGLGVPVR